MPRPAIQLYTLRDVDEPLPAIVRTVAELGFEGVEFAHGAPAFEDPEALAAALEETGVEPVAAHVGVPYFRSEFERIVDLYGTIGCYDLVVPHLPRSHFRTERRLDELVAGLERLADRLADRGFDLYYHNQVHDFGVIDDSLVGRSLRRFDPNPIRAWDRPLGAIERAGTYAGVACGFIARRVIPDHRPEGLDHTPFRRLLDGLENVDVELDVGSVAAAGFDPVDVMAAGADRISLVHHHDVTAPADPGPTAPKHSVDPGEGDVDLDAVAAAADRQGVEWLIFEHDDPTDPMATARAGAGALIGRPNR